MVGKKTEPSGILKKASAKKCPVCGSDMTQMNTSPPPNVWFCANCKFKMVTED